MIDIGENSFSLLKGGDLVKKKHDDEGFCCPEFVPPHAPDDFCIPENCCPQRLETPKFPSPTSCLPKGQTRELEELIDMTNELLLDLALSNESAIEGRMKSFEGLMGQLVEVKIDCEKTAGKEEKNNNVLQLDHLTPIDLDLPWEKSEKKKKKKKQYWRKKVVKMKKYKKRKRRVIKVGRNKKYFRRKSTVKTKVVTIRDNGKLRGNVQVIGRDFVLLRRNKVELLIPLIKVSLIKPHDRFAQPIHEPELLDIDPCLRRALTFNFGETVASSPELIEIFFKLTIPIFLLMHLRKKVTIKIADEEVVGTLMEVNKESLVISMKNNKLRVIPILSICFIII